MAQLEDTVHAEPEIAATLEAENQRLQMLLSDLLKTNQELRFRLDEMEQRAEREEGTSVLACVAALML